MSDPFRFTTIAHADRALLGPLAPERVEALLEHIELRRHPRSRPRIVDVGCGKGEILLRAMRRLEGLGTGVEPNPAFAGAALARARELGLAADLVLHGRPVERTPLPDETFDLAICTGAGHAFGETPDALAALARLATPGGWGLFGVGYWKRTPAAEYLECFGGSEDELRSLEVTLALPEAAGWTVASWHESTPVEWDDYERHYAKHVRDWVATNATDPEAEAFRRRIEAWDGAYERWGRETMGFVTLVMRR